MLRNCNPAPHRRQDEGANLLAASLQLVASYSAENEIQWITPAVLRDFASEQTNAHRLCTADDGWVERFGPDVLISYRNQVAEERLGTELHLWAGSTGFHFNRVFGRYLPIHNSDREAPRLLKGDARRICRPSRPKDRCVTASISQRVIPSGCLSINGRIAASFDKWRRRICSTASAYTCSFSVAAATVGAKTVSIDLSKKSLARGRENFALNRLPTIGHQFIADDVMEVLPRLARKGEKFDVIILDPPTFSRSHRGKAFQVEQDFEKLLLASAGGGGTGCAYSSLDKLHGSRTRGLEVMARFCLKTARRAGAFHQEPPSRISREWPERARYG